MDGYTREELDEALTAVQSIIHKCEAAQKKFPRGTARHTMEFIISSGLSGAGKSKAASFMEDMGFFCVDNLPAPLIPKFAELGMAGTGEYDRVVLVTDVRSGTNFSALFQSLEALKGMK